jgi:two-component system, cell cycle sensor histidine kinase and response regulator CckA
MNETSLPLNIPILLVDDRPENLLSLEGLLNDQGYELVRALSGNEALRLTLKQDFALVLLDVQMPEMDGFETAELMRANPKTKQIPIIFVTAGMKDFKFQFKGYDAGAVDYLAKPIEAQFLQSKVRIFAELYRQRREIELHRNHLEKLVKLKTAELEVSYELLQDRNRELQAVEALLRLRIDDYIKTNDQLLATEEMLRVQIEEYEVGQKLLNEANRNLQTLFDVSPLAILVSSFTSGTICDVNKTFLDDFGYSEESVIGKTGVEIGLWVDLEERDHFLEQMHHQHGIRGFAVEIRNAQGDNRTVLLYSNRIDYKGENSLLIVFMDVTEQKRLEDQMRQTQKLEVIGQLAGGVAHDFNNMLTAILGSAELMENSVKDNPPAMKLLGNILKAANRSAELTKQLLAFSRKGQKNEVQVNIDTMIHDVIALLERTIDKKIALELCLEAKNNCITGDPALLQNALLNLGINARDAMPDGGVITFVTTNVELDSEECKFANAAITPGSFIEISVSDTGIGMSEEVIKHVFDPFFTTKEVGKGTGLGLAAVYGTVSNHHGCINVTSTPGIGTIFKLYLPISHKKNIKEKLAEEISCGSGGVLLVDDEEILRCVGQDILENLGYRVYLAKDGEDALDVYAREMNNISVVILDMVMPKMGGKETLMQLKKRYPHIKVLISSGFHQEGTLDELHQLGALGFIQKPYTKAELHKAITMAIGETNRMVS